MRYVALALVHAAIVLGGVYLMLTAFGDELERELDRQVQQVQSDFQKDLDDLQGDFRREVRRELDRRAIPTIVP